MEVWLGYAWFLLTPLKFYLIALLPHSVGVLVSFRSHHTSSSFRNSSNSLDIYSPPILVRKLLTLYPDDFSAKDSHLWTCQKLHCLFSKHKPEPTRFCRWSASENILHHVLILEIFIHSQYRELSQEVHSLLLYYLWKKHLGKVFLLHMFHGNPINCWFEVKSGDMAILRNCAGAWSTQMPMPFSVAKAFHWIALLWFHFWSRSKLR